MNALAPTFNDQDCISVKALALVSACYDQGYITCKGTAKVKMVRCRFGREKVGVKYGCENLRLAVKLTYFARDTLRSKVGSCLLL